MATRYVIGPSIGVARLGNSPDEFYLEPEEIGGRPIACDAEGNAQQDGGGPAFVARFKDAQGRVERKRRAFGSIASTTRTSRGNAAGPVRRLDLLDRAPREQEGRLVPVRGAQGEPAPRPEKQLRRAKASIGETRASRERRSAAS